MELNPYEYFHENTIRRRQKCHVPLVEYSDLPVFPAYTKQISQLVDSVTITSRWLNMVCVYTQHPERLSSLAFVDYIAKSDGQVLMVAEKVTAKSDNYDDVLAYMQCERLKGSYFKAKELEGNSVSIAVFDVGFVGADEHEAFADMNIDMGYDFVKSDANPYRGGTHGTSVLACIGGKDVKTGRFLGLAPKARFLLARTERNSLERSTEEEYWLAAAEWADKMGVDVINSSLGYTSQRYGRQQMDGKTALVSRAAQMAYSKGILVVSAAGNEGGNSWKFISAPADADSILSIGAIDPKTDAKIDFSSVGPNVNYTMKPNLCAYGEARAPKGEKRDYVEVSGTSFSSPLVAGFVACVIQAFPKLDHRAISRKVQTSGHLYPYFDFAHGYGVPQANRIGLDSITDSVQKIPIEVEVIGEGLKKSLYVNISSSHFSELSIEELGKKNLYFHIKNASAQVIYYSVKRPDDFELFLLNLNKVPGAHSLSVHFEGYTLNQRIK